MARYVIKVDSELESILPAFLERRRKEISYLWNALEQEDFQALAAVGHSLGGSAGGYGFHEIGAIAVSIESAARAKDACELKLLIKKLEDYLNDLEVVFVDAA